MDRPDQYGNMAGSTHGGTAYAVPGPDLSGYGGGPAPSGPYTGTGEFPYPGTGTGTGVGGWSLADSAPADSSGPGLAAPDTPTESLPRVESDSSARRRAGARRRRAGRPGSTASADPGPDRDGPADPPVDQEPAETAGQSGTGAPAPGRAGRDLPAAIGVGVGLVVVILASLFVWRPAFLAVLVVAVGLGTWEMTRAVRGSGARPPLPPLLAGGVLMAVLAWRVGPDALALGLLLTILAMLIWRLGDGPAGYQRDAATATLIAVYVPFLGGFAALLANRPDGDLQILVTLAAVILSDTGGYAAGVFLGRHPMAPTVSPKKSWEGFAGSVAAAGAGSALLLYFLLDVMPLWGAVFGVAVSVAAVLGDLGESMIKRDLRVKDMSNLLPGHGGLMDRLDSILFALPVSYLVLTLIGSTG
ncbi:phosphatidate cytidylyltransferase [Micromonospora sp. NBC_01813]|uniref:phosphatidate cytidylyltransferase n=1 Tax=Micromonospora sp. NBC_01813 TaxID=2975988 RepID=UPI002DD9E1A3|nr:phosphatidate cytidylyltransferase [Micromonospora sp. NBC_01813]WSA11788.1 phosphatidate cytidylyltransferase [Micromonospora sp. NBC_01813]